MEELQAVFDTMKTEALPVSREEFENRAILYHILMDLEEFLMFKRRFINNLGKKQKDRYWENDNDIC